jgi:hypothetical protein
LPYPFSLAALARGAAPLDWLTLRIQSEEQTLTTKTLDAEKDGPVPPNVGVNLKRGILLGGIVKDPEGQPLPAARVLLSRI